MRGMILAAGLGTRMGPIRKYMAKPAVPFLGVPMIERSVGVLRDAGISRILVNLHYLPETVTGTLGDGSALGVKISYSLEDPILGTGGGIGRVRDFFAGQTFAVINSDVIIALDANKAIEAHRASAAAATLVLRPDPERRYGGVWVRPGGGIISIEGHPPGVAPAGDAERLMFAGLHIIEPRWFDYAPSEGEFDSIRHVYGPMIAAGERIGSYRFDGDWIDIGSARRLLAATLEHLEGNLIPQSAVLGNGCSIEHCALADGVEVGAGARLRGVLCIGESRIGEGAVLEDCIVCPGAVIEPGARYSRALLDGARPTPLEELPL